MKSRKTFIIAAIIVAVLIVIILLIRYIPEGPEGEGQERTGLPDIFAPPQDDIEYPDTPEGRLASYERMLEDYKKWAVYPPDSRPLLPDYEDLIDYSIIKLRPQRLLFVDPTDKKPQSSNFECLLQPLKHTVIGTETLKVTLWCNSGGNGAFVPVDIQEVVLVKRIPAGPQRQPTPDLNDSGMHGDDKSGDNIYTMTFRPTPSDWGEMELTVKLKIPSEKESRLYELNTSFFSSPRLVAEFTGNFRENISTGSLVISAEVKVLIAGHYELTANLFTEKGDPVSINRIDRELQSGSQWVDFLFFGKIFHDRELDGPYALTGLRGERKNLPIGPTELAGKSPEEMERIMQASLNRPEAAQPNREVMPSWDNKYRTQAYTISSFSDREYDGADRRERIQMYEEQVRDAQTAVHR